MDSRHEIKSGFIAIIGRPNVGKSTLLNALVGTKVAIVSSKAQTTRNRILGILTTEELQAVFLDTPGVHRARSGINKRMVSTALQTLKNVDIILHMVETNAPLDDVEQLIIDEISKTGTPTFLILNKIDRVDKNKQLTEIDRFKDAGKFDEMLPISALKNNGLDKLMTLIGQYLPQGPHYYPPDAYTDLTERFLAAEMIREQIFRHTKQEIPYASAVSVEEFREDPEIVRITARIHVESKSQKGIIIGKGGAMIKKIGSGARENIQKMVGTKVFLGLKVDVMPKWRRDEKALDKLGYGK